jgi:putative phosphoribosyl transferase
MLFTDRADAGRRLARELQAFADQGPVVLALVRGGVPIGFEIARALRAPLDVLLVRKIGVPGQPELAAGAIVDGGELERIIDEEMVAALSISKRYIEGEIARQAKEIERRRDIYLRNQTPIGIEGCTAIVVDDGIATGASMLAALRAVRRRRPKRLVLAIPVAPADSVEMLRPEVDEVVCLAMPELFGAISLFYDDFHQVEDDEVVSLLESARRIVDPRVNQ